MGMLSRTPVDAGDIPTIDVEDGDQAMSNPKRASSAPPGQRGPAWPRTEDFYRNRLRLGAGCLPGDCPKNRFKDPFCLCHLENVQPAKKKPRQRPSRQERTPAGLRNLGQTCYVNSYLQTLFHTLPVRRTLYEWRRPAPENMIPGRRYDIAEELQRFFAHLQCTDQPSISPGELVRAVGLDVAMQQDVQEFSALFLEAIDEVIADRSKEEKLRSLFAGKCRTVIKYRSCQFKSTTEGEYCGLNLQTKDIADLKCSLDEFFGNQVVDDYVCDRCSSRGSADKRMQLLELPRFLNVHLCRYFFDKATQARKKLGHAVVFPLTLDLKPYLAKELVESWDEDGCCYELMAILNHQGTTERGHYFARIRVPTDGNWYTFDDETVLSYDPTVGSDVDARGAYMLVYEKRTEIERTPRIPDVPQHVDIPALDSGLLDMTRRLRELGVNRFLTKMRVRPGFDFVWLPREWLSNVARAINEDSMEEALERPDLSANLCVHQRVCNFRGLKAVDRVCAEELFEAVKVSPIPFCLDGSMFCNLCASGTNSTYIARDQ